MERLDEDSKMSLTDTQGTKKDVERVRKTTHKKDGNVNEETENLKKPKKIQALKNVH